MTGRLPGTRPTMLRRTESALLLLSVSLPLALAGCPGGDEPALVTVPIEAGSAQPAGFTTALGYDVELDTAVIVLGALHFHEPKSVEELHMQAPLARMLRAALGPATAHAHPGHDMSGDVKGEWPGTTSVDLLAPAAVVGEGSFYEGTYETASLELQQDGVDGDAGLDAGHPAAGHTLVLAGTADGGGGPVPFDLVVDHTKVILGIPFGTTVAEDDIPAVTLTVDPAEILGHLAFDELDSDADGTITLADEGVANPLLFGLESNLSFSYEIQ